jgi:hypothetical protein
MAVSTTCRSDRDRVSGQFNSPQGSKPIIATEANTDIAIALDSPTMLRDPFALVNPFNFGTDNRTTLMLFVTNLDVLPGETRRRDGQVSGCKSNVFPLQVEFVGDVPGVAGLIAGDRPAAVEHTHESIDICQRHATRPDQQSGARTNEVVFQLA